LVNPVPERVVCALVVALFIGVVGQTLELVGLELGQRRIELIRGDFLKNKKLLTNTGYFFTDLNNMPESACLTCHFLRGSCGWRCKVGLFRLSTRTILRQIPETGFMEIKKVPCCVS
jgi:hypothetical protein